LQGSHNNFWKKDMESQINIFVDNRASCQDEEFLPGPGKILTALTNGQLVLSRHNHTRLTVKRLHGNLARITHGDVVVESGVKRSTDALYIPSATKNKNDLGIRTWQLSSCFHVTNDFAIMSTAVWIGTFEA
jgi:hypothetical protein